MKIQLSYQGILLNEQIKKFIEERINGLSFTASTIEAMGIEIGQSGSIMVFEVCVLTKDSKKRYRFQGDNVYACADKAMTMITADYRNHSSKQKKRI
jgi:ribosome-associated translation inhibitor RaiA